MPANGPVRISWQIIFAIISPLNIWAFYRIKKLRKFVMYIIIPSLIIGYVASTGMYYEVIESRDGVDDKGNKYPQPTIPPYMTPIEPQVSKFHFGTYFTLHMVAMIGLTVFSVYLVIKWSRQWNGQF